MAEHPSELPDMADFKAWREFRKLGAGGWGEVYAGLDPESGELRAVKITKGPFDDADAQSGKLFRRELEIAQALDHPHVVRAYRVGEQHGRPYLVMEYCSQGSLAERVIRDGPLPAKEAVAMSIGVLDGLAYAHHAPLTTRDALGEEVTAHGIVHRDLKPPNILLTPGPDGASCAKIADFGLAKAYEAVGLAVITVTGDKQGTPSFMPQAQALDYKHVGPGADVWSATASPYFALTGRAPRDLPRVGDVWRALLRSPVIPVEQRGVPVPSALAELVDHTLRADRTLPDMSAAQLRDALLTVL
ncbi:serine/threonine-protein kinase [Streptomyces sp. NPDC056525]|uniref:serine/threonine-protein kinase n=1 Tax=unclassified Streptomyces TaxID=2593676 RepID=UPI00369F7076